MNLTTSAFIRSESDTASRIQCIMFGGEWKEEVRDDDTPLQFDIVLPADWNGTHFFVEYAGGVDVGKTFVMRQRPSKLVKLLVGVAAAIAGATRDETIPDNPIEWLCLFSSLDDGQIVPFVGVGFFICGDVVGRPTIMYRLTQVEGGDVLLKEYETNPVTAGITVAYTNFVRGVKPGGIRSLRLQGLWKNVAAGTSGEFVCDESGINVPCASAFCAGCSTWLSIGSLLRIDELAPIGVNVLCFSCASSRKEHDVVHPCWSVGLEVVTASGATCSEIVRDSLTRAAFSKMPLLSTIKSSSAVIMSYAQVEQAVAVRSRNFLRQFTPPPPAMLLNRPVVFLRGRSSSILHAIATLAVFLARGVVCPVPGRCAHMSISELQRWVIGVVDATNSIIWDTDDSSATEQLDGNERISSFQSLPLTVWPPFAANEPVAVLFTSASTSSLGKPLAFTEDLALPLEGSSAVFPFASLDFQEYDPTYCLSLLQTVKNFGERSIVSSVEELDAGLAVLEPTHIGAPPSFWISKEACLFDLLRQGESEAAAAQKTRLGFGRRLISATSGGARLPRSTQVVYKQRLGLDLVSLYGCREAGGISRNGIAFPGVDVRVLVGDEPATSGTQSAVLSEGEGELLVHSPRLLPSLRGLVPVSVDDGTSEKKQIIMMYRTGDVGKVTRDGRTIHVEVMGRAANSRKNASGQWITTAEWEGALQGLTVATAGCSIQDACMFSASTLEMNIGCVLVVKAASDTLDIQNPARFDTVALFCDRELVNRGCPVDLMPRAYLITDEPFAVTNGLLTPNGKRRTAAIKMRFDSPQESWIKPLHQSSTSLLPLEQELHPLLSRYLPHDLSEIRCPAHVLSMQMQSLGLDSIGSAQLCDALKKKLGARSPAAFLSMADAFRLTLGQWNELLMHDTSDKSESARRIVAACSLSSRGVDIHFWSSELRRVRDMVAEVHPFRSLLSATPVSLLSATPVISDATLVVGATGFLGAAITAMLLFQGLRVVAAVRSAGDGPTRLRRQLTQLLQGCNASQSSNKDTIPFEANLAIVEDLDFTTMEPVQYAACIYNAAAVSHIAPYERLRESNVDGVVRAAVYCRSTRTPLIFISSIAALPASSGCGSRLVMPVTSAQLVAKNEGYGQSKAVAEAALVMASTTACDVCIVRPGAISPHSKLRERYNNPTDAITLLLRIIFGPLQGVCPHCEAAEVNGVPVDLVAELIARLATSDKFRWVAKANRHLTQAHDDFLPQFNIARGGLKLVDIITSTAEHLQQTVTFVAIETFTDIVRKVKEERIIGEVEVLVLESFDWKREPSTVGGNNTLPSVASTEEIVGPAELWSSTALHAFY